MNPITCVAPVNIAVIKYWGKRDEELILPINDSISASLDVKQLCTKTTVMASPEFETDRIWLNGREESMSSKRLQNCLRAIKARSSLGQKILDWKIRVCSRNNFPTAAGLASSASGYACLCVALAKLYGVEGDVSSIARLGSGSACRSIHGGYVRWRQGLRANGDDSIAIQIAPASHWPEIRVLILVMNEDRKKIGSSCAMRRSLETSEFLRYRAEKLVPKRAAEMEAAIIARDFNKFAEITMRDSNSMHACVMDTYPPVHYLTDATRRVIELVHAYNEAIGEIRLAYTNDAGPNTVLYTRENHVAAILGVLDYFLPRRELALPSCPKTGDKMAANYLRGELETIEIEKPSEELIQLMDLSVQRAGLVEYVIGTRVGGGPQLLDDPGERLLDERGLPIES